MSVDFAIGALVACGVHIGVCFLAGRSGRESKNPWKGCVLSVLVAAAGYALLINLSGFAVASAVIGSVVGCIESWQKSDVS